MFFTRSRVSLQSEEIFLDMFEDEHREMKVYVCLLVSRTVDVVLVSSVIVYRYTRVFTESAAQRGVPDDGRQHSAVANNDSSHRHRLQQASALWRGGKGAAGEPADATDWFLQEKQFSLMKHFD